MDLFAATLTYYTTAVHNWQVNDFHFNIPNGYSKYSHILCRSAKKRRFTPFPGLTGTLWQPRPSHYRQWPRAFITSMTWSTIVPAGIQIRRFHHHPDHRLGAGLTQQNPALAAQFLRYLRHLGLNGGIVLGRLFVLYPDIFQDLRINLHLGGQLCQGSPSSPASPPSP